MLLEVIKTFKKRSDGAILHFGDVIDVPQEKALRLIEKGRARLLPSGTHGNAPSCPEKGLGEATLPAQGETPPPPAFTVGQNVRFDYLTALNILSGVIVERKWHPDPILAWWYRIETEERRFWISQLHVQAEDESKGARK